MRAAIIKQHGPPSSIFFEERSIPEPSATQCLIRVRACGLNHLDLWARRGVPGHRFPLPLIPGSDITGTIEKVGSAVKQFKAGDRVILNPGISCGQCEKCRVNQEHLCAQWGLLGESADGGCQEYIAVEERQVHLLPSQLSFEQGACIPIAYVTSWQMLLSKAHIQAGQSILIHAAGSGVSVACIQIAKLHGLKIFVTSTSDKKIEHAVKVLGVDGGVNSAKESFREAVKNWTQKSGVDVVVDHVGKPTFSDSIRSLKRGGVLVSCGATAGADLTIDWKPVFFKNIALLGSTYGSSQDFKAVLNAFEKGSLTAVLDHSMPFVDLPKAHEALESHQAFGKIVVTF
jgi:NADPH:quinone reductase-like Zn-dependent oxidoreductase